MQSKARTVKEYLAELPADRRAAMEAVRRVVLANLDKGFEEGMQYGMIGYYVPHRLYPAGYHCDPKQPLPYAGLASQKNYMSVYLTTAYMDKAGEKWLRDAFARAGKKLDMGKCCIRFKRLEDLPLEVIGEAIRRAPLKAHIEFYERAMLPKNKAAAKKSAAQKGDGAARTSKKKAVPKKKVARKKVAKKRVGK